MRKTLAVFLLIFLLGVDVLAQDNNITKNVTSDFGKNLLGKILLQVESNGEAWYLNPKNDTAYLLGRPEDAFKVMREQGVGINNENLNKIPVAVDYLNGLEKLDSDGDSYNDKQELIGGYNPNGSGKLAHDTNFTNKNKGVIFLQVESNGEAWYVNPNDNKRYYLGRPADAFRVMRELGLGITNDNFAKISDDKVVVNKKNEDIKVKDEKIEPSEKDYLLPSVGSFSTMYASDKNWGFYDKEGLVINDDSNYISNVKSFSVSDYGFVYSIEKEDDDDYYDQDLMVNINGKEYGPYYNIDHLALNNNGYILRYKEEYVSSGGTPVKININGIIDENLYYSIYSSVSDNRIAFMYKDGRVYSSKPYFINIDGNKQGPYDIDNIETFEISDKKFIFVYCEDGDPSWECGDYFVNVDGIKHGPYKYQRIDDDDVKLNDNDWAFQYTKDDEKYLNINGVESGPYYTIKNAHFDKRVIAYIYKETKEDNYFLKFNDKEYDLIYSDGFSIQGRFSISNDGSALAIKNSNDEWIIEMNDKEYGPYEYKSINSLFVHNGELNYIYNKGGNWFVKAKGVDYGPYNGASRLFVSDNKVMFTHFDGKDHHLKVIQN